MTNAQINLAQIKLDMLASGVTPVVTVLPSVDAKGMEDIHGKLLWAEGYDSSIPTTGDTGESSDGTQAYKTSLEWNDEYHLDGLTGYSLGDVNDAPLSQVDEAINWELLTTDVVPDSVDIAA